MSQILLKLGVSSWWIQRLMPSGKAYDWPLEDFVIGNDCINILKEFSRLRGLLENKVDMRLDLSWGPNFFSKSFLRFLIGDLNRWPWTKYACPMITQDLQIISLESNKIYPCWFMESFYGTEIGYISSSNKPIYFEKKITNQELYKNIRGICSGCEYFYYCRGGCRSMAFTLSKKRNEAIPIFSGQDFCITRAIEEGLL